MPKISSDQRVRIYGRFHGTHSLAQVAEGFSEVFEEASRYDLDYWENSLDELSQAPGGVSARTAIFLGPLSQLPLVRVRGHHHEAHVMVAPNSDRLGARLLELLEEHTTRYLVPSEWAAGVLRKHTEKPVQVLRHGVLSSFGPRSVLKPEEFTVLHLSSTLGERKGTMLLVEAWAQAGLPNARLLLSVPGEGMLPIMDCIEESGAKNVSLTRRLNYEPEEMSILYSSVHYVCQPSRGEGFGLVPLEARVCGTPVIATTCTGHSEHVFGPGIVEVPTGEESPIDDLPGAMAPALRVEDLAEALVRAHKEYEVKSQEAREHAPTLRALWTWKNQLEEYRNGFGSR